MADANTTNLNLLLMDVGSHVDTWGGATSPVPLPPSSPYHPASLNDNFQVIDAQFPTALGGPIGKIPRLDSTGSLSIDYAINIGAPATNNRLVQFYTGLSESGTATLRWFLGVGPDAETGSNAGSNFEVGAANDAGVAYLQSLTISRANGVVNFNQVPTAGGPPGTPVVTQASFAGVMAGATAGMIGEVRMWAGPASAGDPPSGAQGTWMLCNGRSLSAATYGALFGVIGTVYGSTGGGGTFNLPDIREHVVVGQSPTFGGGATPGSDNLGAKLGVGVYQLAGNETPQHNHGISDPHHTHTFHFTQAVAGGAPGSATSVVTGISTSTGTPSVTTSSDATGIGTLDALGLGTGSGSCNPHQNVQPSIVLNYIIRVL
jgi:microcystin-dependent protein